MFIKSVSSSVSSVLSSLGSQPCCRLRPPRAMVDLPLIDPDPTHVRLGNELMYVIHYGCMCRDLATVCKADYPLDETFDA